MRRISALVLGVGGNVSQGIVKALRQISTLDIRVYGACINECSAGLYMCDSAVISPYASDPGFVDWCIDYCNENQIDIVFTGVEENIDVLLKNDLRLRRKTKAIFILPQKNSWDIGLDKYLTVEWLEKNDCNAPDTILLSDENDAFVFFDKHKRNILAKPRSGKSSFGIYQISTCDSLLRISDLDNYILQECIGDNENEYTVGCYFDKHGRYVSHIIMHRYLKNGGTSVCEIVEDDVISEEIFKIANQVDARGPLNIQLRIDEDGKPVTFEWNVRYSGTTAVRNHFGFCDVEAAIREYLFDENPANCFANQATGGTAVRYDEEMYFDGLQFQIVKERYLGKLKSLL